MGRRFRLTFFVWPYSGVKREPARYQSDDERKNRGAREPTITVDADNFEHAVEKGHAILDGIRLDERVWECGLTSCQLLEPR